MQAGGDKTAAEQSGRALEPAYLLPLFFACPPQGFAAEYAPIPFDGAEANAGDTAQAGEAQSGAAKARGAGTSLAKGSGAAFAGNAAQAAEAQAAQAAPQGAAKSPHLPLFSCRFSLLTALDDALLARLRKYRFYPFLSKLLTFRAVFCGATVTEFAPLPLPLPPAQAEAAAELLLQKGKSAPFIIAKDLPEQAGPLTAPLQAQAARNFTHALEKRGFISVEGQALAYVPLDFADIDAYLARLSKARRKDFRRKLRAQSSLKIEVLHKGDAAFYDEEQLALYYSLYQQVYAQSAQHFDFLGLDFFRALLQKADDSLRFITYREASGRLIGYNICFALGDALVDKYIGLSYPAATQHSLYFISWFYNLNYAKSRNLRYYVAGWTDRPVKAALGAQFAMTRHAVYIRNPLLRVLLRCCRSLFESKSAGNGGGAGGHE